MNGQRTYPHGVTSWIDTEQPDLEAAEQFYRGLFGWTLTNALPPGVPDSYLIATLEGEDVAAIAPASGGRAGWNTYVAIDDADETAAAVVAQGGQVVSMPEDAGPGGRAATCADPFGAEFRLWQARRRLGAQRTNLPGSWNFSHLHTADREAAMAFYSSIFGWVLADLEHGGGGMIQVPGYGQHLASTVDPEIYERQAAAPKGFADVIGGLKAEPGERSHWEVVITVADRDESVATAERLGATLLASSDDLWTRNAQIRDPQGAEFTLSQFTPPS